MHHDPSRNHSRCDDGHKHDECVGQIDTRLIFGITSHFSSSPIDPSGAREKRTIHTGLQGHGWPDLDTTTTDQTAVVLGLALYEPTGWMLRQRHWVRSFVAHLAELALAIARHTDPARSSRSAAAISPRPRSLRHVVLRQGRWVVETIPCRAPARARLELAGHLHQFRQGVRPHLLHDASAMRFDGDLADAEFVGDLFV